MADSDQFNSPPKLAPNVGNARKDLFAFALQALKQFPEHLVYRNEPRLCRTAKARLGLVMYRSPKELEEAVARFQRWYNEKRYHEAIGNLRPIDIYHGRGEDILARRKEVVRKTIRQQRMWNLELTL